jgi:uncharacterized phage protein (TIGR02218 family)
VAGITGIRSVNTTYPTSVFTVDVDQATAYFNEGLITFTSGDNFGITREIRDYTANNDVHLYLPLGNPVQAGDQVSMVRGDDKRHTTCRDTFNNLVNFGGFPSIPGIAQVYRNPAL